MVRTLTSETTIQSQTSGSEPLTIVEIDWESSVNKIKYADKDISEGGIISQGRILTMGSIRSAIGPRQLGSSTAVRVTLLDDDLAIRELLKTNRIEDKTIVVFQYFAGLAASDLVTLIRGKVGSPVFYDEQEREFSFTIVGAINSKPVGDSLQDPQVDNPESTKGKPWPVAFGHVKDVPALLYKRFPKSSLREKLGLFAGNVEVEVIDTDKIAQDIYPAGAFSWIVGGEILTGGFGALTGENTMVFIGTPSRNLNRYTFSTGPRPSGDLDFFNPHVLYMSAFSDAVNGNINVTEQWVTVGGVRNYCIGQEGTKLFFQNPFSLLVPGDFTATVRKFEPETKTEFDGAGNQIGTYINGHIHEPGTIMELYNNDISSHDYIVNQLPTTEIKEIKAFRRVDTFREPQLVCIPDDYYEQTFTAIEEGKTATVVSFKIPLSQRDEGWSDENIYVTMQSSVGRNTADQIKFILENYTDLTVDTASFTAVRDRVANFPSDFAVLNGGDAIQIANEMAWQSRCALYTVGSRAFIKFLADDPLGTDVQNVSINAGITDEESSFVLTSSGVDTLVTVLNLMWKASYAEEELEARFAVNEDVFGERREAREIFIYQNEDYVEKTGNFWIQRLGRLWRIIAGSVFLDALPVELLDYISVNYPDLVTPSPVIGQVMVTDHNTGASTIGFEIWLPIEVGTNVISGFAYQSNTAPSPPDPLANIPDCTVDDFFIGRKPEFLTGKQNAVRTASPGIVDSVAGGAGSYMVTVRPNGVASLPTQLVQVTDISDGSALSEGDSVMVFQSESGQYYTQSSAAATAPQLDTLIPEQEDYPFRAYNDDNIPGTVIQHTTLTHWTWMLQGEILAPQATGFAQPFVRSYLTRVYLDTTVQFQGLGASGRGRSRYVDLIARQHPQNTGESLPIGTIVWVMAVRTQGAGLDTGNDPTFINDDWRFIMLSPIFLA